MDQRWLSDGEGAEKGMRWDHFVSGLLPPFSVFGLFVVSLFLGFDGLIWWWCEVVDGVVWWNKVVRW